MDALREDEGTRNLDGGRRDGPGVGAGEVPVDGAMLSIMYKVYEQGL